jgi:hypothetical protein
VELAQGTVNLLATVAVLLGLIFFILVIFASAAGMFDTGIDE